MSRADGLDGQPDVWACDNANCRKQETSARGQAPTTWYRGRCEGDDATYDACDWTCCDALSFRIVRALYPNHAEQPGTVHVGWSRNDGRGGIGFDIHPPLGPFIFGPKT